VSSLTGRDEISTGKGADFVEAFSSEPTTVDLGPGDDYLGQNITPGSGAAAQGGPGDDAIAFYGTLLAGQTPRARFTIDYRTGVTTATGDVPATGTIGGFEGHRLIGSLRWAFFGVDLDERVWAIQGGPLRARTGGGADAITGTPRDDLLDGGAGSDTGSGRGGQDVCRSVERGDC
jgi:Ca2+-binding RTX toxin-like protein